MEGDFDIEAAKKFLASREKKEKEIYEEERKLLLKRVTSILKEEFAGASVEVYLVGSITRPYAFAPYSDVDIVLKNYEGDRLDIWSKLEKRIPRDVQIIIFETCSFQEFVLKDGLRIL